MNFLKKIDPTAALLGVAFTGLIAGGIALGGTLATKQKEREVAFANEQAERELYDQRLRDEGCVVKGREGQRAIYVCPDGSATLGQVREVRQ